MTNNYINFNINQCIKVKLYFKGRELVKKYYSSDSIDFGDEYLKLHTDENNYTQFQMWEFMRIFGNELSLGCILPFNPNTLIEGGFLLILLIGGCQVDLM